MSKTSIRTYTDMQKFESYEERLAYLQLTGSVGSETFGFDRYLNQLLYRSSDWKRIRDIVIIRDGGNDLGCDGLPVYKPYIHHMNPISKRDIETRSEFVFNPEYLITTSFETHNAIHYGGQSIAIKPIERRPNDTCPWK